MGKRNKRCRFVLLRYTWSKLEQIQYDRDGTLPGQIWRFDKRTPVIPLTFARSETPNTLYLRGTRASEYASDLIKSRPATLVVMDLFPPNCQRLEHGRCILPSTELPLPMRVHKYVHLISGGILDQYLVDEDKLIETIWSLTGDAGDSTQTAVGSRKVMIDMSDYCWFIQDVLKAGVDQIVDLDSDEDDST